MKEKLIRSSAEARSLPNHGYSEFNPNGNFDFSGKHITRIAKQLGDKRARGYTIRAGEESHIDFPRKVYYDTHAWNINTNGRTIVHIETALSHGGYVSNLSIQQGGLNLVARHVKGYETNPNAAGIVTFLFGDPDNLERLSVSRDGKVVYRPASK